jgi:hypothetical protein
VVWARYVKDKGSEILKYVISKRRVWRPVLGRFGRWGAEEDEED